MGYRYTELADQIERGILGGEYRPGERLPSIRVLRSRTGLSIMTINRALRELEVRGLVDAKDRSGFFVRRSPRSLRPPRAAATQVILRDATLHALTESVVVATAARDLVPLGGAALSPQLVPTKHLARIAKERLSRDPSALARYSDSRGLPILRTEIAKWLLNERRSVDPDDIVVTQGAMDAVRLSLMSVASASDVVAVESPTFFGVLQALRDLNVQALEIPVDPSTGLDLEAFAKAAKQHHPKAVVVTPAFRNATGARMTLEHKRQLLSVAVEYGVQVIEDPRTRSADWFLSAGAARGESSKPKALGVDLLPYIGPACGRSLPKRGRLRSALAATAAQNSNADPPSG